MTQTTPAQGPTVNTFTHYGWFGSQNRQPRSMRQRQVQERVLGRAAEWAEAGVGQDQVPKE